MSFAIAYQHPQKEKHLYRNPDHYHKAHFFLLPSLADSVMTPNAVLEGIQKKAKEIVGDPNKIVPAPGCFTLPQMVEYKIAK